MYLPPHFREDRLEVLQDLMRTHAFATLVTYGASGLLASHVPLHYDSQPAPYGALRGHLSRANPQWRDFSPRDAALAIFAGPHQYISPSWYAAKEEHGRVVPTWNYAVVHAYGTLRLFEDPEDLRRNVETLTARHEAEVSEWRVADAPAEYIEGMLKGIVGIEMGIDRIEGKWKLNQNRSEPDRAGVEAGLRAMADLVAATRRSE